jgi:hypothetical protein
VELNCEGYNFASKAQFSQVRFAIKLIITGLVQRYLKASKDASDQFQRAVKPGP